MVLLSLVVPCDVDGATVIHDDVVVDHDVVWSDDTIQVHGNVTVLGGMHLTLLRSTLEIVGNTNGTHWFNASARSVLTVQNGTIRGSPYHISIRLDGTVHMVDSTVENVWTTSATPAIDISGVASWLRTTVQGCPNSTGVLVTGALEAEDCEFKDMGEVALAFSDPRFPNRSFVSNSTFVSDGDVTGDTIGIAVQWSSNTNRTVDLTVYGCLFDGFTFGIQALVNTTRANLSVHSSRFYECSTGLQVTGNGARITITGCTFDISETVGLRVYVVDPMLKILNLTINNITSNDSSIGVYVRGPSVGFRPLLQNLDINRCDHGIQALGANVRVEDSMVIDCGVDFYAESKSKIEVRRTVHTHRSAQIAPAQHAAVVVFGMVDVTSCRWKDAQYIDDGLLYLFGEDGVELERVDLADPVPVEVVIWSLTRYYDLGRYWVVPTYRTDGHEFTGLNFSIYNTSSQDVVMIDHLPPEVLDVWPEDGQWYQDSSVDVSGRLVENGSGLDALLVRIVGGQEVEATVPEDGNWSVTFDPVDDCTLTIEIVATDRTGGTAVHLITNLTVDTVVPEVELEHSY
ncbi:MAG: right-handed parallel beta-helix repeat-containing protein, partial [Thermoplasmata archaeon]|nr:right-handed parallel beta-helix repeat-containing protein [Thermoplasmata archaeon]